MRELGPNEGMNALRHPDCRWCDEYQRLLRGAMVERDQWKERALEAEQNSSTEKGREQ